MTEKKLPKKTNSWLLLVAAGSILVVLSAMDLISAFVK